MSKNRDYGYFGKGSSGYAHYMQSFNETSRSNGGGHSNKNNNNSDNQGCLIYFIGFVLFALIAVMAKGSDDSRMIIFYILIFIVLSVTSILAGGTEKNKSITSKNSVNTPVNTNINSLKSDSTLSDNTIKKTSLLEIVFMGAFLLLFSVTLFVLSVYATQQRLEDQRTEVMELANAGNYIQAFDLADEYFKNASIRKDMREAIKNTMPEKDRLEMFPADYVRFTLVVEYDSKTKDSSKVIELIYINESNYDVKISNIECCYINSYNAYIEKHLRYENILPKNSQQGYDEYYDNSYYNDSYVLSGEVRYIIFDFDIEILE